MKPKKCGCDWELPTEVMCVLPDDATWADPAEKAEVCILCPRCDTLHAVVLERPEPRRRG